MAVHPRKAALNRRDYPICPFCDKFVVPGEAFMQEEAGWTKARTQGGTNHLHLRRITGNYAHAMCVDMISQGIDPAQQALL
jgi:hypothetical protein